MSSRRSASVGALPHEKKHFVSRNESGSGISLDVRCGCQYFQCDSLLPDRTNPIDSRPSSKLGFHDEQGFPSEMQQFQPMNIDGATTTTMQQMDQFSARSYNVGGQLHIETDRVSMRSIGQQRSWEQGAGVGRTPSQVDLAFVEKYPELEETARSRGLVVRTISDANEPEMFESNTFVAGRRRRQMSVGGISASSGRMHDPETWSMRSGTSLRRISRSPSKGDLFVADINIQIAPPSHERLRQRSASASRRTSNVDLSHFASYQAPMHAAAILAPPALAPIGTTHQQQQQQFMAPPQLNLIAPTPSPAMANMRPDFERASTPQRSSSPSATADYRIAKPPLSTDYMRPDENKENVLYYQPYGGVLPQHRPIDTSKYGRQPYEQSFMSEPKTTAMNALSFTSNLSPSRTSPHPATAATDPLEVTVAELEAITATRNIEDIHDTIKVETKRPPSFGSDIFPPSLNLGEETNINIVSEIKVTDIDLLVQSEKEKAASAANSRAGTPRPRSPSPKRAKSPPAPPKRAKSPPQPKRAQSPAPTQEMNTLQLPSTNSRISSPPTQQQTQMQTQTQIQMQLKRQHTPERQLSPERSKKYVLELQRPQLQHPQPQLMEMHTVTIDGPLQEASPEVKSTYASRFKSMFTSSKSNDSTRESFPKRQKSPSPLPSPKREKSPSLVPAPASSAKLVTMFSKPKPTQMAIVSGSNAIMKKQPDKEPMSVKVTETFSLKVDEMDQYGTRSAKMGAPPPPSTASAPSPMGTVYSSREDFLASEQASVDISEAFAPIVISSPNRGSFFAGHRTLYSSEIDMRSRRSESELHRSSKEALMSGSGSRFQIPKGTLISVPINIGSSGNITQNIGTGGSMSQHSLPPRAPSEQRAMKSTLTHKSSFMDGRTQSQDRARIAGSSEDIYAMRMTKTVSFNFDERKSRLSEFEKSTLSQQQKERDFLERTYLARDHEYEPIGEPQAEEKPYIAKEPSPAPNQKLGDNKSKLSLEIEALRDDMQVAEDLQKDLEERYFSSETTTPRTESRTETYEIHTSQVDSSALEELPLKPENRKKGFMASAQDRTRKMQAGFKNQAGKIKTKIRSPAKKPPSGSPKAKERKRFKAPEFSKIKMPEIKRPDMSKLKEFKRPEFTKFNKPDMSKFKLPEKFSTLKLRRSKSLKENDVPDDEMSGITPESGVAVEVEPTQPPKKMFEVNFGTFPRAFRKKKPQKLEPQPLFGTDTGTEGLSVIPSTETQPSMESSSSPQGDRGPGPVRSRWADKFSDVSYNDSEGSRYRRYGSEQESFDRESSLERRMKEDLEETGSEGPSLGILSGVGENKQFAEFDEENRAIHEISNLRAGEFKRRPMIHQDSDLRSEDSKEAEGWTDKEIQKNKLLRKAELEAEASYLKYPSDERMTQETQSTASSGKKVVMEEIDDDEFFLRKRGVSEDNIELRKYISEAIREGYDDMPINSLQHVGQTNEPMEYGDYDIPPPKPRRLLKSYRPEDVSQEFGGSQRSDYGDDLSMSQNDCDFFGAPKRPIRKGRSRSKYSMDSQDVPMTNEHISHQQYFDDDEDYLRPPPRNAYKKGDLKMNDLNLAEKEVFPPEEIEVDDAPHSQPQPPSRRRKRQLRESTSMDKDSYINGFGGRSVSNSYLQPPEDVIVYRTEHEYPIPLATPENYTDESRKSRSASRYDEDDRTSRGADSLALDGNLRSQFNDDTAEGIHEKFVIDMMESDGYAIVRKEHMPKPTPPARRKKFTRSPGERFATLPTTRTAKRNTPPPERPPPPRGYTPTTESPLPIPPRRKSAISLEASQNYEEEDDYEEPELVERPESPRNLQSGEIINKMKYRPLPPPPRPPREKRQRAESKGSTQDGVESSFDERDDTGERIATSSTADSYDHTEDFENESRIPEVEVSTQTDPLPDDFVCEEFEITEDMKVIEPRRKAKTIDEMIKEELEAADLEATKRKMTEDEQLQYGLQRFREANQRSMSERSRTSSQLDRSKSGSKSASRPPTPSAIVIERRVSTPLPSQQSETMLEAAIIVRPIDDLDLEEEALRREGLLTDSSQQSKSDVESHETEEEEEQTKLVVSDYSQGPSSDELDAAIESLRSQGEESEMEQEKENIEEEDAERRMRDYGYADDEEEEEVEDDDAERYSNHYDEDEEENAKDKTQLDSDMSQTIKDMLPTVFAEDNEENKLFEEYETDIKEHVSEDPAKYDYERKKSEDREQLSTQEFEKFEDEILAEEPPQPPPRRKSTTAIDPTTPTLAIVEQPITTKDVAPVQSFEQQPQPQFPTRLAELEVERLRVHALQAGQIMVSQLHGTQISSDELECKSGSLVVKNIELPPGFIEDIVERVRSTDRSQLLTAETQTSLQASSETLPTEQILPVQEMVPPPKPPRHKDFESLPLPAQRPAAPDDLVLERLRNFDEQTQTDPTETTTTATSPQPPPVYATTEYLQSLGPLAFYNMRRADEAREDDETSSHRRRRHHHHHYRKRDSSCSETDEAYADETESQGQRHRSRSSTRPLPDQPQTVVKAGRQFISACSLSLVNIINQLTGCIRGTDQANENDEARVRQVPTLVVLFIVITFGLLLFLLSGKSVHTHHWDYFNPPGNEGRPS